MNVGPLLLLLGCIVLGALFSGAEAAAFQLSDARLRKLSEEGERRAELLLKLSAQETRRMHSMQLLLQFACICGSVQAAVAYAAPLAAWLGTLGLQLSPQFLWGLALLLLSALFAFATLLFSVLVPGRVAVQRAEETALRLSGLLRVAVLLCTPFTWLLDLCIGICLRLCGINPHEDAEQVSEEDIIQMLDAGTEKGTIDTRENEFIQNVFEFNDLTVEDVCTHRTDVVTLYLEDSDEEWQRTIHENRFAHYPICGESDDDVLGILDTKDYFRLDARTRSDILKHAVDKPFFVSQNMNVADLFQVMKRDRNYYAVALDEYGGMTGIVTLHDLVEALVGDLQEEDELPEPVAIEQLSENEWIVQGLAELEDVNEALSLSLPLDDCDTFGGYILGILGKVPDDGSSFRMQTEELEVDVVSVQNHRIVETLVRKRQQTEQEPEEAKAAASEG